MVLPSLNRVLEVEEGVEGLALFHSSPVAYLLSLIFAVVEASRGRVLFIDGFNTANVYLMSKAAEGYGFGEEVLRKVFVSRAFTAYQVLGLLKDLDRHVEELNASCVILSEPLRLFLDDDFPRREGLEMANAAVKELRRVVPKVGRVLAFTSLSPSMPRRRGVFVKLFEASSNTVVQVEEGGGVVTLTWVKPAGKTLHLSFNGETLDSFLGG